jgi:hypothetical protein
MGDELEAMGGGAAGNGYEVRGKKAKHQTITSCKPSMFVIPAEYP